MFKYSSVCMYVHAYICMHRLQLIYAKWNLTHVCIYSRYVITFWCFSHLIHSIYMCTYSTTYQNNRYPFHVCTHTYISSDVYSYCLGFIGYSNAIKVCVSYEEDNSAFLNVKWDVSYVLIMQCSLYIATGIVCVKKTK